MPPKVQARPGSKPAGNKKKTEKKKAAPKQPLSIPERLKRLFNSLCAQIDGGHFTNAIKTCDKILRIEPKDKDALQTKLFLLLQTEQYNTALALIGSDDALTEYAYEKAYSLYREHHEQEARDVLESIKEGEDNRGVQHLEAQLDYREGVYQKAFDLYNELLDTAEPHSEEHADILTNLEAAQKHLDFVNTEYLRALDALPPAVTSSLETAPPPQPSSSLAVTAAAAASVAATSVTEKKTKKVRAKRVPKGVVPGVTPPPDPERWLKKSERSTFGQGRRRKAGGGGATQGAAVDASPGGTNIGHGAKGGGKGKKKK